MTRDEADKIFGMENVAIEAPAGFGKTESIADLTGFSNGTVLILTHTNAGVEALKKRMLKKDEAHRKNYVISTIASYCKRWCMAYSHTAKIDLSLLPYSDDSAGKKRGDKTKDEKKAVEKYYDQMYNGAKEIFSKNWAGEVLKCSYSFVIVDEYQDCSTLQHEVFVAMNRFLPVYVFGDPMQVILDFTGGLVDWPPPHFTKLDLKDIIDEKDYRPYRWEFTNIELGKYLETVRETLKPAISHCPCTISVQDSDCVKVISDLSGAPIYNSRGSYKIYESIAYITKWDWQQKEFSKRAPAFYHYDETVECNDLIVWAHKFDKCEDNYKIAHMAFMFTEECFTNVNKELGSYLPHLESQDVEFGRIKKYCDLGEILKKIPAAEPCDLILSIMNWFSYVADKSKFKFYRKELYGEMARSVQRARDEKMSICDVARNLRMDSARHKNYSKGNFLSSKTLLSKGLEFDCVIIDMCKYPDKNNTLNAKEFYVAMTRAKKMIYIVSPTREFLFG